MGRARDERRKHRRMALGGRAVVFRHGDPIGNYSVQNLSAGGALMTGERDVRRGHLVHVFMNLENANAPLSLTASVQQVRKAEHNDVGLAMVFRALSADDEDRIHDSLLRTLIKNRMQDRSPVLIYEPRRRVRAELETEIRSFGLPVVAVGDLMSAVKLFEDDESDFGSFVIHSAMHEKAALEVAKFFAREDDVHVIILPDPGCRIPDPATRLSTLPHVSVPAVWSRESLRGVLCN